MEPVSTESDNAAGVDELSDDELVERVKHLAACERRASVAPIRSLVEFDSLQMYLREGCSSLFTYCTHVLHLSEGSAYNRIETARAARRYPNVLKALARVLHPDVTYRRRSGVQCGGVMRDAAGSSDEQAGAVRLRCSSSIMLRHTPREPEPRRTTFSSAATHNEYEARLFFGDTLVRERSEVWVEHTLSDRSMADHRSSRQESPFTQDRQR
jgi:hypothetical protein